jgi:WD40 repeat protein
LAAHHPELHIERQPATQARYSIFAILESGQILRGLRALDHVPGIQRLKASIACNPDDARRVKRQRRRAQVDIIEPHSMAELIVGTRSAPDLIRYISYPLLSDAAVLVIRHVGASALDLVAAALSPSATGHEWPLHLLDPEGPVCLAIPEGSDGLARVDGHVDTIDAASFSRDSTTLITIGRDRTAKFWNPRSSRLIGSLFDEGRDFQTVQINPGRADGDVLTIADDKLRIWSWPDLSLRYAHRYSESHAQYSPDGTRIAASSILAMTSLRDAQSMEEIESFLGRVTYSADGAVFSVTSSVSQNDWISIYDAGSLEKTCSFSGHSPSFSPDGLRVASIEDHFWQSDILIRDVKTGETLKSLEQVGGSSSSLFRDLRPRSVVFGPDGSHLLVRDYSGNISIWRWDKETDELVWGKDISDGSPGFTPDGSNVFSTDAAATELLDLETGSRRLEAPGQIVSFGGTRLMALGRRSGGAAIDVWCLENLEKRYTLPGHSAVFSPDACWIVTLLDDSRAVICRAADGTGRRNVGCNRVLVRAPPLNGKQSRDIDPLAPPHGPIFYQIFSEAGSAGAADAASSRVIRSIRRDAKAASVRPRCSIRISAPDKVSPGQVFLLGVTAAWEVPQTPARAGVTSSRRTKPESGALVSIRLNPVSGFDLDDEAAKLLDVHAGGDASAVSFQLKAKSEALGSHEIELRIYQDFERLGILKTAVEVAAGEIWPSPKQISLRYPDRTRERVKTPPPDVVLYVDCRNVAGRDTLHYSYRWIQNGGQEIEAGSVLLETSVAAYVAAQYDGLDRLLSPSPGAARSRRALGRLAETGRNLYRDLFSDELKEFYRQLPRSVRTMLIYSNEASIPWELTKPSGPELKPFAGDFFCLRFEMSRWHDGRGQRIKPGSRLRVLSPVVPVCNSLAVREELRFLRELPRNWPPLATTTPLSKTAWDVLGLMEAGTTSFFHFAAHRAAPSQEARRPSIAAGMDHLDVEHIHGSFVEGLLCSEPFVFMNACQWTRRHTGLDRSSGWIPSLLEFGCCGVVAADWNVGDATATEFAAAFYNALLAGGTAAGAVRRARRELCKAHPTDATPLAYRLYAHPNLRVEVG